MQLISFFLFYLQFQVAILTTTEESSSESGTTPNIEQTTAVSEAITNVPSTTLGDKIVTKLVSPESRKVPTGKACEKPQNGWTKAELIRSNDRCMNPSFCFAWQKNGFKNRKHCRGWCSGITAWAARCVDQ